MNLRWSWRPPTAELFRRIDPALWEATSENPVLVLRDAPRTRLEALAADPAYAAAVAAEAADLERYLAGGATWYDQACGQRARVAYFSAEFGITRCLCIFSGGLGVLAGDHLKSASDLGAPLVAVGLFYREGYFEQHVDGQGAQHARYPVGTPEELPLTAVLTPAGEPLLISFPYLDRRCNARVWRADVGRVPLYLLDTDIPANPSEDRAITDRLYGGDNEHRLQQEIVLGIGGMRTLRALDLEPDVVHLNEGHAAFAGVERVRGAMNGEEGVFPREAERLRSGVVFTTHTPVAAGHDAFDGRLMERYLGGYAWEMREPWERFLGLGRMNPRDAAEPFSMTILAFRLSERRNGVSRLHGQVSREMWHKLWPDRPVEQVPIGHVTNGVHLPTWVGAPMAELFTGHIGGEWREAVDDVSWQRAMHVPGAALWAARRRAREALVVAARRALAAQVARDDQDPAWTAGVLDPDALTIVFARRFATYKRAWLLLSDPERLLRLLHGNRPVQFVFAGKAHPRDLPGQEVLRRVAVFAQRPDARARFVFLENYEVGLARTLVQGADVWLNVPRRPHEASGTSGMKAAANGALNLSILDGWWAEAWTDHNRMAEPIGWAVEGNAPAGADTATRDRADAEALFRLLEEDVVPLFHERGEDGLPGRWLERVRATLRQVAPYFSTHRMVREYVEERYLPGVQATGEGQQGVREGA